MSRRTLRGASTRVWRIWRVAHWLTLAMLGMSLIGAVFMYWHNVMRDEMFPKRFAEVEEGRIYRSGQISEGLLREVFVDNDIQLIVDLAGYEPRHRRHQDAEDRISQELEIEHLRLPLQGSGTGDPRVFALAIAAIDRAYKQYKPVLVHCTAGSRRSAAVVASYQVLVRGIPPEEAFYELERYGSSSLADSPMVPFLNENLGEIAALLVEMKVIPTAPDPMPSFPWES